MVDYKALLRKYLYKVGCEEGITFAPSMYDMGFSAEEVLAFRELEHQMFPPGEASAEIKRSSEYTEANKKLMLEDLEAMKNVRTIKD